MDPIHYRNYIIEDAPSYTRKKYQFIHQDYDGGHDKRIGVADTIDDCKQQINEKIFEQDIKEEEL
jgi:hypothetical protein